jgi:hypothetical protein
MNKRISIAFLWIIGTIFIPIAVEAKNVKNNFAIGLGYPYLSAKCKLIRNIFTEIRTVFENNIQIYGIRGYYNFSSYNPLFWFTGFELDYTIFSNKGVSGDGFIIYSFVGAEHFINEKFSIVLDIGPAFITLKERNFNLSVDSFEWVINLGVYCYLK